MRKQVRIRDGQTDCGWVFEPNVFIEPVGQLVIFWNSQGFCMITTWTNDNILNIDTMTASTIALKHSL